MMLVWKETKLLLRANKLRLSLWMESRLSLNRPTLSRIGFSGRSRVRRQAAAKQHNDTTELPPEKKFTRTFRYDLYVYVSAWDRPTVVLQCERVETNNKIKMLQI